MDETADAATGPRGDVLSGTDSQEEFARLVEDWSKNISYFFARRGCPPEECRDLAQETFLRAYRGLSRFQGAAEPKLTTTWLLRVATNVWKNSVRERRAIKRSAPTISLEAALEAGESVDHLNASDAQEASGPLDRALGREKERRLSEAIRGLPPRMRRSVQLRIDRGLRYDEIAAIMQVSVYTVKTQLHQARQRLKEQLGDYFEEHDS